MDNGTPLVSLKNVHKVFGKKKIFGKKTNDILAVNDVSLDIAEGEVVGLVGESGCGKSTLGRVALRLYDPTEGKIFFAGHDITAAPNRELVPLRKNMQMIFQDPYASLNPRMTVRQTIAKSLKIHGDPCDLDTVRDIMREVGLDPALMDRYPHEFSGGQRQRIAIGRAISIRPKFVVCDEPVSALDASVQAQVINLLIDLHKEYHLAYLFISHDLSVVRHISDRVVVMYLGRIVEIQKKETFFEEALHPYSQALLSAIPVANPDIQRKRLRILLKGDVQSLGASHEGCPFYSRCPRATAACASHNPALEEVEPGKFVACIHPLGAKLTEVV